MISNRRFTRTADQIVTIVEELRPAAASGLSPDRAELGLLAQLAFSSPLSPRWDYTPGRRSEPGMEESGRGRSDDPTAARP